MQELDSNDAPLKALPKKSKARETVETVVVALGLALITRAAVAEPRYIPSESMLPTLKVQDRLIVEKISNYTQKYKRGDILVFYPPSETQNQESPVSNTLKWLGFSTTPAYIKRVIGLPGETLEVRDGKVWINGKALEESAYIKEPPVYDMPPVKIPENNFFMMGDNRNNSMDSHVWGTLPTKNIIGHAAFRFWPLKRIGTLD